MLWRSPLRHDREALSAMKQPHESHGDDDASTVEIWLFSLSATTPVHAALYDLLDGEERQRAARFILERDRHRYIVAHGAMRSILGLTIGMAPAGLEFVNNPWGKPALPGFGKPFFSLSHTADLGALAIGWRCPVGVDIEQVRPIEPDVARMSFSPAEQEALASLAAHDWLQGFYRCWTRKEAVIKALGLGLAQSLDGFDVTLTPDEPPRLLRLAGDEQAPHNWQLQDFAPAHDILGAFAAPVAGHQFRFRHWSPDTEHASSHLPD